MINELNFQLESKDSVFCCNRKEKKEFNFIFIKNAAEFCNIFRIGITGTAFSAAAGIFIKDNSTA